MLLTILFEQPAVFVLVVVALVVSLTIHEFAHAFAANKLGDDTPRLLGRLTLNPKAHLDPLGSILLIFAGFGWGKPVPINPINFKNPKRDSAIVSVAGPASNLVLAALLAIITRLVGLNGIIGGFLYLTIFYNVVLGIFNLLPIHPLDGFKVIAGILPPHLYIQWMQMQQYGVYLLLILVVTGGTNVIIDPLINGAMHLLGL